jgi:hypothetical protein
MKLGNGGIGTCTCFKFCCMFIGGYGEMVVQEYQYLHELCFVVRLIFNIRIAGIVFVFW